MRLEFLLLASRFLSRCFKFTSGPQCPDTIPAPVPSAQLLSQPQSPVPSYYPSPSAKLLSQPQSPVPSYYPSPSPQCPDTIPVKSMPPPQQMKPPLQFKIPAPSLVPSAQLLSQSPVPSYYPRTPTAHPMARAGGPSFENGI